MPSKPTSTRRPRGRPSHVPTAALRAKVASAAGAGMRHEDIAVALGICRDTLAKHYEKELSVGANQRRLEAYHGLYMKAKTGNAAAVKLYLSMEPEPTAPPLPEGAPAPVPSPAVTPPAPADAPTGRAVRVGKKEQQQIDAQTAAVGSDWEDLLRKPATPPTVQ